MFNVEEFSSPSSSANRDEDPPVAGSSAKSEDLDLWAALPAEGSSGDVPNKDIREDVCAEELSGSGVEVMAMTMLTIKRSSGAGGTKVYRDLHLRL
jgi:hypothetical protein